ncbi:MULTISPECIES: helix-turn-helix transcriptional regulator [unclassified Paraburkholderia]|uniref:helix-turn-helix domain-containing protein n=1 Tax=unclassified Paraburkholderia TaxID=2615204 RepID=UPI002AB1A808|nr:MULTISPECIES: helix-turn-helix transcriptional regulator [unclassified Paraburkholderia]
MTEFWQRFTGSERRYLKRPVIAKRYDFGAGDIESWHSHTQPQFVYTTRGVLRVITPDGAWTLGPYRGLWISPLVAHELQAVSPAVMYTVYFEGDIAPRDEPNCHVLMISTLLNELVAALALDQQNGHPERRSKLIDPLLLQEMREAQLAFEGLLPLPKDRRLQQICGQLMDVPADNTPLNDWGTRVGASESTLERAFKEETGLTFGQWRQRLRLVESIARLAKGMPVSTIAADLGYRNSSAFITMFRRAMGETPQRFLRSRGGALEADGMQQVQ